MTVRELVYMILDQVKLVSDDSTFNEEHVFFITKKLRAALLIQKYKTGKVEVADANYQVLCVGMEEAPPIMGICNEDIPFIRSTTKVPNLLHIGNDLVTPLEYLKGINISLIPIERMRYVGHNPYLRNIIYAAVGHDGYLYMKSHNPQFRYLKQVKMTGVFEDIEAAFKLLCDGDCSVLDNVFPMEDALVESLVELAVKELVGAAWRPLDDSNNANDDMATMATFLSRNTKSSLQKQIES